MKLKILPLLIAFSFCNLLLPRSLNVILILDTIHDSPDGPLTKDLAFAFQQKAAPIIVSENILYNFLSEQKKSKEHANRIKNRKHSSGNT